MPLDGDFGDCLPGIRWVGCVDADQQPLRLGNFPQDLFGFNSVVEVALGEEDG